MTTSGMKLYWTFFLLLSIFIQEAYSRQIRKDEKPISLDSHNLTQLRDGAVAKGIKKGFCSAITIPRTSPDCKEGFSNARRYKYLLHQPFLLVDQSPNSFGGFFLVILFKEHPEVYRAWVYEINEEEFEVREMIELTGKLNQELMQELRHPDYLPYWLNACP